MATRPEYDSNCSSPTGENRDHLSHNSPTMRANESISTRLTIYIRIHEKANITAAHAAHRSRASRMHFLRSVRLTISLGRRAMDSLVYRFQTDRLNPHVGERQRRQPTQERRQRSVRLQRDQVSLPLDRLHLLVQFFR